MLKVFLVVMAAANTAPTFTEMTSLPACWKAAEAQVNARAVLGAGCAVVAQ